MAWFTLRYYPSICFEESDQNHKTCQNGLPPSREVTFHQHEAGELRTRTRRSSGRSASQPVVRLICQPVRQLMSLSEFVGRKICCLASAVSVMSLSKVKRSVTSVTRLFFSHSVGERASQSVSGLIKKKGIQFVCVYLCIRPASKGGS